MIMKTITFFILAFFLITSVFAQTPQSFCYQAVARDNSGNVLANKPVSFKISILSGSVSGTVAYSETHTGLTTNAFGLVELEIGKGTPVTGTFSTINWGSNSFFVKIEMDPAGGTTYQTLSTSQLLSVPYALHSKTVETGDNWGSQVTVSDASLAGNGTTTTPLKIADGGVTSAKIADGTIITGDLANNSVTTDKLAGNAVTTDKINTGAVTGDKIAQAGATNGQALKWNGTTWAPAADATGGGGWTDDGMVVRLTTTTDSVQIGSVKRLGKFNVGGDIGLNLLNSIYFGSDATRISSLTGGDLRFVAEDLSMLTTEDITFGHYGDETWIKFDNTNKRVGIGTLSPTDRLHVLLDDSSVGLSAVRGVATSAAGSAYGVYGQSAGFKGRGIMGEATGTSSIGVMGFATNTSSTGVWGEGSNQGVYGKSDLATGKGIFGQVTSATAYSGYFDGGKFYISGNTGIGTTTPAKKLHVYGSAQIKDTLYANVVNASKITTMPGLAHSIDGSWTYPSALTGSWAVLNSVTVNVPAPGYVLLIASCGIGSDHTSMDVTSVFLGVSKTSDGTGVKQIARWFVSNSVETGYINEIISSQAPLQVTSAGTQTFYLMAYRTTGDNYDMANSYMTNLTAVYIPVAYGTVE
jgi:hypothetical protein